MEIHFRIILILSLLFSAANINAQHNQINWVTIEEAQELMKKEPRKVLIDVHTKWCGPCKMMMKNTFTNPEIIDYINKHYYAVKFNAEGNEEVNFKGTIYKNPGYDPAKANSRNATHQFTRAIAPVNGRVAYPTIVYMDENFNILTPVQGYLKPDQLMPILKYFGDNAYRKMDWNTYLASYGKN